MSSPKRSFGELWWISGYLFREVMFRAIQEMRANYPAEKTVKALSRSTHANKMLITIMLVIFLVSGSYTHTTFSYSISLALTFFMMLFLSLSFSVSYVSSTTEWLEVLPLSREEISKIRSLAFLRLYDYPLLASATTFAIATAIFDSPFKAVISIAALVSTITMALAATIKLSEIFYEKIYFASNSKWASFLRAIYMLAWVSSLYFGYFVISLSTKLVTANPELAGSLSSALSPIYPFSFGNLISNPSPESLLFSTPYFLISLLAFKWLSSKVSRITPGVKIGESRGLEPELKIKLRGQIGGMIVKDLKVATRNPALLGAIFLPIFYSVFYSYHPPLHRAVIIGTVILIQTIMCVVALMFFSPDRSQYIFILPVTRMKILISKAIPVTAIYLASILILTLPMILNDRTPLYILISSPSAVAIIFFSLAVAFKYPLPDLYSGYHMLLIVFIPSLLLASFPVLAAYLVSFLLNFTLFNPTLALISTAEMLGVLLFVKSVVG